MLANCDLRNIFLMNYPISVEINLVVSDRQRVEIDHFPERRGVWLDRDELDKIIERPTSGTSQPQVGAKGAIPPQGHGGYPRSYGHPSDPDGRHHWRCAWPGKISD